MTAKSSRFFWTILLALLTACGHTPPATEMPTITAPPSIETMTLLPTFTPNAGMPSSLPTFTPAVFPTLGPYSSSPTTATFTPTSISSPAPIPVSTATEIYPLDNLRMAYIADGNLYVQNGSNPPKKLSDSGKDWSPMFSDDGEKIVFYRGKIFEYHNSIFSVNDDGSQMREIITTTWLNALAIGTKAGHLAFVPNTHQFLFNTYLCPKYDPSSSSGCTVGLFLANSDTGKIKEILKPTLGSYLHFDGDPQWLSNFSVSPDGNLLSVAHDGQIDILDLDGKTLHRSIMKYVSGTPYELYPKVYWFPDSGGLIIALPAKPEHFSYTIWKFTFNDNVATQILLESPPIWTHIESNDVISVSPNREWVLYFTDDYKLYKGNLLDGKTDILLQYGWFLPLEWNSDSTYFAINGSSVEPILGSVSTPLGYLPGYGSFVGWIDAKRFIYIPGTAYHKKENIPFLVGETDGKTLHAYETKVFVPPYSYFFALTVLNGTAK